MIVAVSTLCDELSEYNPAVLWGDVKIIQYFRPVYHGVDNGFFQENLYIGNVSQLPESPPEAACCYALIQDVPLPEAYVQASRNTYILVPGQYASIDLYHIASDTFESQVIVGLFSADLLQCVQQRKTPEEILKKGHGTIKAPLFLMDFSMAVLARAGEGISDLPEPVLQELFGMGNQRSGGAGDAQPFYEMSWEGYRLISCRITLGGLPIAYLIEAVPGVRISDRSYKLFRVLSDFLSLRMRDATRYLPDFYSPGNPFLHDLLQQESPDAAETAHRAEALGIHLNRYCFVLSLEPRQGNGTDDQMRLFAWKLRQILSMNYMLIQEGRLTVLYDTDSQEPFSPRKQKQLDSFLIHHGMMCVASLPFEGLHEFPESCRQTVEGLAAARKLSIRDSLIFYESLLIPHMLLRYGEDMNLRKMVPPSLWLLCREDEERGQEFVKTLFVYIENNCNMTQAAKALKVHYNTLKYRIQRICELTGIDFSNPDTILRLHLSKHILHIIGYF